jgi:hypothetical protein
METLTTRHPDGTVDVVQSVAAPSQLSSERLEELYWDALRRSTVGLAAFSRDAVRVFGLWPAVLRFGPHEDGRRQIVGGLFAREPHGLIRWQATDDLTVVSVERFAPLLQGPLWRFESWFHDVVGRRFLARATRVSRS